jgi:hypothetical protein
VRSAARRKYGAIVSSSKCLCAECTNRVVIGGGSNSTVCKECQENYDAEINCRCGRRAFRYRLFCFECYYTNLDIGSHYEM